MKKTININILTQIKIMLININNKTKICIKIK